MVINSIAISLFYVKHERITLSVSYKTLIIRLEGYFKDQAPLLAEETLHMLMHSSLKSGGRMAKERVENKRQNATFTFPTLV